jgi:prevent-host-death family protein
VNRTTSLTDATAHLTELVDAAEYRGERVVIVRDGRPAAAIVPVRGRTKREGSQHASDDEAIASLGRFITDIGACEPEVSAVNDLLAGRR